MNLGKHIALMLLFSCAYAQDVPHPKLPASEVMPAVKWPAMPSPPLIKAPASTFETLSGAVIRYNYFLMSQTSQIDLIVQDLGSGRLLRLRYCPHDCGFDAPQPTPDMVPPKEMTTSGNARWVFEIHSPYTEQEKVDCASIQKSAVEDRHGNYLTFIDPRHYRAAPGRENSMLPRLSSLPCFTLSAWRLQEGRR
jgi:hypothetical protein